MLSRNTLCGVLPSRLYPPESSSMTSQLCYTHRNDYVVLQFSQHPPVHSHLEPVTPSTCNRHRVAEPGNTHSWQLVSSKSTTFEHLLPLFVPPLLASHWIYIKDLLCIVLYNVMYNLVHNLMYWGIILCIVVADSHHRHHTCTLATIIPDDDCNHKLLSSVHSTAANNHLQQQTVASHLSISGLHAI